MFLCRFETIPAEANRVLSNRQASADIAGVVNRTLGSRDRALRVSPGFRVCWEARQRVDTML